MDKRADCSVESTPGEGSKNKRKLPHASKLPNPNITSSSLIEFPPYELSAEISGSPEAEIASSEVQSHKSREEPEVQVHELVDWIDPIASPLEELLLSNLQAVFASAIKQIVELGYSEDEVGKAISGKGLYIEEGDPVSNIVQETINFLNGKDVIPRDIVFEDFQHLLHYTMVEMISVLCEVRPSLTVSEAMWLLLIFDLNIFQACEMDEHHLSSSVSKGENSASCINPQSKSGIQGSNISTCVTTNIQKDSSSSRQNNMSEAPKFGSFTNFPNNQSPLASKGVKVEAEKASLAYTPEKSSRPSRECAQAAPKLAALEGKSGPCKRHDKKEIAAFRKKYLHMEHIEKSVRNCGKGGFKPGGKLTKMSFVEKRLKTPSEIRCQHMKGGSSSKTRTEVSSIHGMCCQVSTNTASDLPAGDSSRTLPAKVAMSSVVSTKNLTSDKRSTPTSELNASDSQKILDYCAGIPYDKSSGKYLPRDQKDKLILKLVLQMQKLKDELKSWNDWAQEKIRQATQRLIKNQAELNILRKEKQEAEMYKKEKKILEENAVKRISEMENAVANATSQIESANSAAHTLEGDNSGLKEELAAAKLWAVRSMASYQQALEREQMALKKVQLCENQKGLLLDELEREKHKLANLQKKVDKEKSLQVKAEGRMERLRVEKEKLLAQAASIRKEREQLEARAKVEEDMIRKKATTDMQKYEEDIAKLEKELAELKLKSESEKIAALRRGIDGRNDSCSRNHKTTPIAKKKGKSNVCQMMESFQNNLGDGSLRREQECVMCLSEEMSVVFLPCAHQVVCAKCNQLHEKQGMQDCPSCRTPIKRRIQARFARK